MIKVCPNPAAALSKAAVRSFGEVLIPYFAAVVLIPGILSALVAVEDVGDHEVMSSLGLESLPTREGCSR
jgi:hypothetical protein